jgi:hypothetical protein
MLKIMRNMVMYNKFQYFGEIIKNGDRSLIPSPQTATFVKKKEQ